MNKAQFFLLKQILSQPTAPFREDRVIGLVCSLLEKNKVPHFQDIAGNIIVGARSEQHYLRVIKKRSKEPLRVFVAHMDHPGFHGKKWVSDNQLEIKWHGGSPTKHVSRAKVWVALTEDSVTPGSLEQVRISKHGYSIDTATVKLDRKDLPDKLPAAKSLYGGFDFKSPVWTSGKRIYTRAADDLAGVFCILSLAMKIYSGAKKPVDSGFIGLLTRAEEVGFVGAIAHFELGLLQQANRKIFCVSLEASRTLPGAIIGKGPVIRLGDRRTVFDPGGSQILSTLAQKALPGKHQRRIMDGGSCEGTAATTYGIPVIAMSVPLGNYHNEGFEGGQGCKHHGGPAPEFVHADDVQGQLKLCQALMSKGLPWANPWQKVQSRLQNNHAQYNKLLFNK